MTTTMPMTGMWARRLTALGLALTIGGAIAALTGAIGSGAGLWPFTTGFTILRFAFYSAMAGAIIAILAFVVSRRTGDRFARWNFAALLIAVGFALYLLPQIATARRLPGIHDITTDLVDPPRFESLPVRADNLENVPDEGRPELAALQPEARWKAVHRRAYGDLRSLRTGVSPTQALRSAEALVRDRRWEIVRIDKQHGAIEATATSLFFRFKDDVVVRVLRDPAVPGGSIVDMRSISRVGGSDVGVNAARIRAFLSDLRTSLKRPA